MNKKEEKLLTEALEKAVKSKEEGTWEASEGRSESSMSQSRLGLIHSPLQLNAVTETLKAQIGLYHQNQVQSANWSPSDVPLIVESMAPYDGMVRGYRAYQVEVFFGVPLAANGVTKIPPWQIVDSYYVGKCDVRLYGALGTAWEGRRLQAACNCATWRDTTDGGYAEEHLSHGWCECGIYATFDAPKCWQWTVVARCCLWGAVVVHERGYRAQFAEIEELFVDQAMSDDVVKALEKRYEVPVTRVGLPRLEMVL